MNDQALLAAMPYRCERGMHVYATDAPRCACGEKSRVIRQAFQPKVTSKYFPHQHTRERTRRLRQCAR